MEKFQSENIFPMLSDAIEFVEKNKSIGCICPCCNQIAKVYKRKIHTSMVITLIHIFKESKNNIEWIPVKDFLRKNKFHNGHDWTLLRYWGLLEEKSKKSKSENETKSSGFWKITDKGKNFVENKITVESHIYLFDSKLLGYSDNKVNVVESLGNKFNYNELINSI